MESLYPRTIPGGETLPDVPPQAEPSAAPESEAAAQAQAPAPCEAAPAGEAAAPQPNAYAPWGQTPPPQSGYAAPGVPFTGYSAPSSAPQPNAYAPWGQNPPPQGGYAAPYGYQQPGYPPYAYPQPDSDAGKPHAAASLALGLVSIVLWIGGYLSLVSAVLGVIGIVLASRSKTLGYRGGMRTAGFVLSLIGLIGGLLVLVFCAFLMLALVGHF